MSETYSSEDYVAGSVLTQTIVESMQSGNIARDAHSTLDLIITRISFTGRDTPKPVWLAGICQPFESSGSMSQHVRIAAANMTLSLAAYSLPGQMASREISHLRQTLLAIRNAR